MSYKGRRSLQIFHNLKFCKFCEKRSAVIMAIGWFFLTSVVLLHFLELQPLPDRKTDWNCLPEAPLCGYASSDFVSESVLPIYQLHQLARRIRHFASTPRGRKNHTSRSRYYANSDSIVSTKLVSLQAMSHLILNR